MTTNATANGPELLEERSIGGVLVHLLSLMFGFFGAGTVYLLSSHRFTRQNARNALNWHLTVFLVTLLGVVTFVLGADTVSVAGETVEMLSILPAPFDTIAAMTGWFLLFVAAICWFLTLVFAMIATIKAIVGSAWRYPGSIGLV